MTGQNCRKMNAWAPFSDTSKVYLTVSGTTSIGRDAVLNDVQLKVNVSLTEGMKLILSSIYGNSWPPC